MLMPVFTLKPVGVDGGGAVVGNGAVVAGFDGTVPGGVVPVGGAAVLGCVVMTSVGTAVGTEVGGSDGGEPEKTHSSHYCSIFELKHNT